MRKTLGVASTIALIGVGLLIAPLPAGADSVITTYPGVGGANQRPSLALSADGSLLYTADGLADRVSVIDTATGTVLATIPTPDLASTLTLSPDGTRLYVGVVVGTPAEPDVLIVIDTATRSVLGSPIPLGGDGASGIEVSPDGSTLYVPVGNGDLVHVIDTATRVVGTLPNTVQQPRIPALSPDGTGLYVSHFQSPNTPQRITFYDLTASPVTPTEISLPSSGSVDGMTMSPDGAHVYFTQRSGATVSRLGSIDTATHAVTMLDGIGAGARQVAITPDGTRAYVTTTGDNAVAIIDLATNIVVSTAPVPGGPQDIIISPDGRYAYTSNVTSGSVSKIAIDYAPTITTTSLPDGTLGEPYSATVVAAGFPSPTFTVTGALPPGLSLDPATGAITGTPTDDGSYTFTVTASNSVRGVAASADRSFTIVVTRVLPPAGAETGAALAPTGAEPAPTLIVGGVVLLLGSLALLGAHARRRRVSPRA